MAEQRCARHPRRRALSTCVTCGRALCRDCIVPTPVGQKCAACTSTRRAARAGRVWAAAAVVILVALAGAGLAVTRRSAPAAGPAAAEPAAQSVVFRGFGGLVLHGTLDLPPESGEPRPGVVIVPGFGQTTREGVTLSPGRVDALYRDLGELFAVQGMVVLRYDKRLTGRSVPVPGTPPLELDQHVTDAAAAVAYLRSRPEVEPARVAVVGHDQGGWIGLRLAAGDDPPAALVLVSTPGRPLGDVLAGEIRRGGLMGSAAQREQRAGELEQAVRTLLETGTVPEVSDELRPAFPPDQPAYLRSIFSVDPVAEARGITAPVLIVHGEQDLGIRTEDVEALEAALAPSPAVDVHHAPQAGHTLQLDPHSPDDPHDGTGGMAMAPLPRRDRDALTAITDWLAEHV